MKFNRFQPEKIIYLNKIFFTRNVKNVTTEETRISKL